MQVDPRPWQRGAVNVGGAPRNDETIGKEPPTMTPDQLGKIIAQAVRDGDTARLENAARACGTYQRLVAVATAAGVDPDELEEMLASI
jgi:hypothetical protein